MLARKRDEYQGYVNQYFNNKEEDVHKAVKANTRALNESLGLIQKFEGWMDRLLQEKEGSGQLSR